jgi:hypothetical protein
MSISTAFGYGVLLLPGFLALVFLRKTKSSEIYVIWYAASFFFVLFFGLQYLAAKRHIKIAELCGSHAEICQYAHPSNALAMFLGYRDPNQLDLFGDDDDAARISFALVTNPRASFTHFVDNSGLCAAVDSLNEVEEARVGIFADVGPLPTEAQLSSVLLLAEMATVKNPKVEINFGPGTSPFAPHIIERQVEMMLV